MEYRRGDGELAFIGVETKYTDPFSTTVYDRPTYRLLVENAESGFRPGAYERLLAADTNQLLRNTLLALSLKKKQGYAAGHVLVVACEGDVRAAKACRGIRSELIDPESVIRHATLEQLIAAFKQQVATQAWATAFERRYLDLTPVRGR
jgi:hypothetical protein